MKYKLVVKSNHSVYVKKRSKSKSHLEDLAVSISKKKPHLSLYVVKEDIVID